MRPRQLLSFALLLGLLGGLLEATASLILQHFDLLANVWYPFLWIAPAINAIVLVLVGAGLTIVLSWWTAPLARRLALFTLIFLALFAPLVTGVREWIQPYAIVILTAGLSTLLLRWVERNPRATDQTVTRLLRLVVGICVALFVLIEGGSRVSERVETARLPQADKQAPDVLLLIVDTLRADHLSSYGYNRPTSPNIDTLAAQGVLFEQAYSTSSYTLPSHASILTGLYPSQHNVRWGSARSQATATYPTLPDVLKKRGYRTGAFSANTFWFTRAHGFGRGFLHFNDVFWSPTDMLLRTAYAKLVMFAPRELRLAWEDIPARKRAPDNNRALLDWIDRDADRPAFAVVNYMDVHDPYLPPEPFRSRFAGKPHPGGLLNWELHVPDSLSPEELQSEIDAYDGGIAYVDHHIGELLTTLRSRRRSRELVVVLTSDHGEEFGEHGQYLHGNHLYREVIHVPLIVSSQGGRVPAGRRVSSPVSNAAIAATIANLLQPGDQTLPGPPLQTPWSTQEPAADGPLPVSELEQRFWESERSPVHDGSMWSVVSPFWHYIAHETRGEELYRWPGDAREAVNVAGDPALATVVNKLRLSRPRESRGLQSADMAEAARRASRARDPR